MHIHVYKIQFNNSSIRCFYIIYANDFSRASSLLFTIMFANGTSVFIENQSYVNVYKVLNEELKKWDNWIKANKLTLNVNKNSFHDLPQV